MTTQQAGSRRTIFVSPVRPGVLMVLAAVVLASVAGAQHEQIHEQSQDHSSGTQAEVSPYAGLEIRPIKALSPEEVVDYRTGSGMGLAMAAELNGYPGPKHVLELREHLALSPEQMTATERAFEVMRSAAVKLGGEIVEREEELDGLFAGHGITHGELTSLTAEIARLQGELRAVHLRAHLEMVEILSPAQRHAYMTVRGYHDGLTEPSGHGRRVH